MKVYSCVIFFSFFKIEKNDKKMIMWFSLKFHSTKKAFKKQLLYCSEIPGVVNLTKRVQ